MSKRTYPEVRKAILEALKEGGPVSYGALERKVNTNWKSIRMHCDDLVLLEFAKIKDDQVILTPKGKNFFEKLV